MKIKRPILCMIAIAIMGLMITSATSIPMQQSSSNEDDIGVQYMAVQFKPMEKTIKSGNSILPSFAGVPVTSSSFDVFHPSVAGSPTGGYYALVEESTDGYIWQPNLYGSADGTVWDPILSASYDNAQYTDMDQNAYGTYGTFGAPPDASGQIIVMQGEIEDGWVWDFGSFNMNEFSNNHIACYTFEGPEGDPGNWNWGGLTFTGYNGYTATPISGCPYTFYQDSADGQGIIGWMTGSVSDCQHVGSNIDQIKNIMYSVYDRFTGTVYELLVRKDNYGLWQWNSGGGYWVHPYMTSMHVTDTGGANLTYPAVAAYNNTVIVACQKNADVVAFYSTNGFTSKTEVTIETGASYPDVEFGAEGIAVITYIKDGVLYYKISEDGGATWGTAAQVSDNQVNLEDRASQIDEFGGSVYAIWEDTRDAAINAYFEPEPIYGFVNNPPATPTLDGPTDLKKNKNYTYTFSTTDPEGNAVSYMVEWGDGTSTGWITETSASHAWAKGNYEIRCKAKDSYGAESGYATLEVKAPRSRLMSLRFLDLFPNAFPILRMLFGY